MEYLWKNRQIAMSLAEEMPCSCDKQETKKVPTNELAGASLLLR